MLTVWVVTIENEYNISTFVYDNEAAAKKHLHDYVREWWTDVANMPEVELEECPDDYDVAIPMYFNNHPHPERGKVEELPILSTPG